MAVRVDVTLVGVFGVLSGRRRVRLELPEDATVEDVVARLVASFPPGFEAALVDPVLGEPGPNALILVNGREVSVLDGVGTVVGDGDEVVFVPATHIG